MAVSAHGANLSSREIVALVAEDTEILHNDVYRERRTLQAAFHWIPVSLGHATLLATGLVFVLACSSLVWQGRPGAARNGGASLRQAVRWPGAPVSARGLFEDPEVQQVAADNVMRAGRGLLGADDRDLVLGSIALGFRNVSRRLAKVAPEAAAVLDSILLSQRQVDTILATLRLIGDPRVQRVGLDVARAVRQGGPSDTANLRQQIELRLASHLGELRQLRQEVAPGGPLHAPAEDGERWQLAMEPDNLRALASVGGDWEEQLALQPDGVSRRLMAFAGQPGLEGFAAAEAVAAARKLSGVRGAAREEGRALLRLLRYMLPATVHRHGRSALPGWWSSSREAATPVEVLSCELPGGAGAAESPDLARALACPLRLGAAGVDALQVSRSLLERSPDGDLAR